MSVLNSAASQTTLDRAARCLLASGVVLLPTDTVFGLAGLPNRPSAIAKIFELKARPAHKNLPVMISSERQLVEIGAQINNHTKKLMNSPFCPGPLSMAIGLIEKKTPEWLRGRDEFAFRLPDDEFLLHLLDRVGPLFVTSANRHGMSTFGGASAAAAQLCGTPDFIIDGKECGSIPSTLVNCRYSPPRIERIGIVTENQLLPYIES